MSVLKAKTNELKMVNNDFQTIIRRYNSLVTSFYKRINDVKDKTDEWSGSDAIHFIDTINKNKVLYDKVGKTMTEYSNCLNSLAEDINNLVKIDKI